MKRSAAEDLRFFALAFGVFAALFALLFRDVVFGGSTFVKPDIYTYYYPVWKLMTERMRHGGIPLWNSLAAFGVPFFANGQSCVLYPPTLILYAGPFVRMFNIYIVFHLALAGAFTSLWAKSRGISALSAVFAGVCFAFSGYLLAVINLTVPLASVSYFPVVLYFYSRAVGSPQGSTRAIALTSAALWLQYAAGDVAVSYATLIVLALVTLVKAVERSGASAARSMRIFLSVFVLFAAASAVISLPYAEALQRSQRWATGREEAFWCSMPFRDLLAIIVPGFSGIDGCFFLPAHRQVWLNNYYCGVIVLVLAMTALAAVKQRRRETGLLAGLASLGLLLSLGAHTPFFAFLRSTLPFFGMIRSPVRFYFIFSFAVSCLAAFGLEAISSSASKRRFWGWVFVAAFAAWIVVHYGPQRTLLDCALRTAAVFGRSLGPPDFFSEPCFVAAVTRVLHGVENSLAFVALVSAVIFLFKRGVFTRPVFGCAIIVLSLLDLVSVNDRQPKVASAALTEPSPNIRAVLSDSSWFRVMASPRAAEDANLLRASSMEGELTQMKDTFASCLPMMYGLYDARDYGPFYLSGGIDLSAVIGAVRLPGNGRVLDMLGVKYFVSPLASVPGYRLVSVTPYANLFLNPTALPRAFIVAGAVHESDREATAKRLLSPDFDPLAELIINEPVPASGELSPRRAAAGSVTEIKDGGDTLEMTAELSEPGWLFVSDAFYPGWTCRVNGQATKIYKANLCFRAVRLEAGKHRLLWRFEPHSVTAGAWISGAACLALLAMGLRRGPGQ